jgi:S1-C subfamily serine protease
MEFFVKRCCQIVVKHIKRTVSLPFYEILPQNPECVSKGSGFIIQDEKTQKKYVITNFHVIKAYSEITLKFNLKDNEIRAYPVFVDPTYDLAFLTFEGIDKYEFIHIADNSSNVTDDSVLYAVGYPLGLQNMQIQQGKRTGYYVNEFDVFIQHSCALNHGNSGGPLLIKHNRFEYIVVGINNAIIENANLIDFAITIERLKTSLDYFNATNMELIPCFHVGVETQKLNNSLKEYFRIPSFKNKYTGIRVKKVYKRSIAYGAFEHDDIIIAVNGLNLNNKGHVIDVVKQISIPFNIYCSYEKYGDFCEFDVIRNKEIISIEIQIQKFNPMLIKPLYLPFEDIDFEIIGGMVLTNISTNAIDEFKIPHSFEHDQQNGVVIVNILTQGSVNEHQKEIAKAGTVLIALNDIEIKSLFELRKAMYRENNAPFYSLYTKSDDLIIISRQDFDEDNDIISSSFSKDLVCRYMKQSDIELDDLEQNAFQKMVNEIERTEIDELDQLILKQAGINI